MLFMLPCVFMLLYTRFGSVTILHVSAWWVITDDIHQCAHTNTRRPLMHRQCPVESYCEYIYSPVPPRLQTESILRFANSIGNGISIWTGSIQVDWMSVSGCNISMSPACIDSDAAWDLGHLVIAMPNTVIRFRWNFRNLNRKKRK